MKTWKHTFATGLLALALTGSALGAPNGATYAKPEDAVKAAATAFGARDNAALTAIFGPDFKRVQEADPAERIAATQRLGALFREGWKLTTAQDQSRIIRLGYEGWAFPVPLVKTSKGWQFDTLAGEEELANRRVGRNELATIDTLNNLVEAETAYHSKDRNGDGELQYTAKLFSTEGGDKDGLFWKDSGNDPSPLGALFGKDAAFYEARTKGTPWYGYYYSVTLTTDGYVLAAWPAAYGDDGVMSFWTDQSGRLYEKDLGSGGGAFLRGRDATSNPEGWTLVTENN